MRPGLLNNNAVKAESALEADDGVTKICAGGAQDGQGEETLSGGGGTLLCTNRSSAGLQGVCTSRSHMTGLQKRTVTPLINLVSCSGLKATAELFIDGQRQ